MLWQLLPCIFWYFSLPETVEENLHKLYTGLGATLAEKKKKTRAWTHAGKSLEKYAICHTKLKVLFMKHYSGCIICKLGRSAGF